ncbi:MAG: acetyl-CoA decarbonylase/synthase complex subunit gamma [Candidatus Firestonebacteria bacterium]
MALTGLEIFKLLPKTNCGKCGSPTCLAFAMRLAAKKANIDECPDISSQSKSALGAASAPPIRLVTIGAGEDKLEVGNETVLFRHEQTFYHPTGLCILLEDTDLSLENKITEINNLIFERVGQILKVNLIALKNSSNDVSKFTDAVKIITEKSKLPLILISDNPNAIEEGLKISASGKPLVHSANLSNYEKMANLSKQYNVPLVVSGKNLDELSDLTQKITSLGVSDLILEVDKGDFVSNLSDLVQIRRLALKKTYRPLGYPVLAKVLNTSSYDELFQVSTYICKYASIVILSGMELWEHLSLLTLRQNIYTDPQKPIQVESKIYDIGAVSDNSPVLVTTNFSLTYSLVSGEVEASRIPSYIIVINTEGISVLTAWAADKFNAEVITKYLKESGIDGKIKHKKVIIPGGVAVISGKLQELSGWEVLVGTREATGIPAFLKGLKN